VISATRKPFVLFHFVLLALASACGGGDETAPGPDRTPVSYNVLFNEIPTSPPYTFTVGQKVRVRLKLFNAAGDDLDAVEAEHFAGLSFNPAGLVTVTRVAGHTYQFDVTGANAGTGTLQVGFGDDEQANDVSLPSADVNVVNQGGPN
jgi:hypothetical protein